uniref:Sterile alpha motif domain containing 11 n=1 Tax=Hucho hucho TaxID=62062 RepID=A0A4W5NEQ4_9TELE
MSKGILQVHPPICDCPGCRISSPVNRGRLAEKRTIPLPPNRVPKRELSSVFSSDDSEGSDRASGDHAYIKQEDELRYIHCFTWWTSVKALCLQKVLCWHVRHLCFLAYLPCSVYSAMFESLKHFPPLCSILVFIELNMLNNPL